MNRMIAASKQGVRATFSHGQMRNALVPISRFLYLNGQKPFHSWSKRYGATPLLDHLWHSKNQERELHKQKEPQMDISLNDEFHELGPSVATPPRTNLTSSRKVPQKKGKSIETPKAYGDGNVSMMNHLGEDGDIKKGTYFPDLVSVAVDNVPMGVKNDHVREAMCAFGDVKAISAAAGYNGLSSYHVQFKNRKSRDIALRRGVVTIGSNILRINQINTPRLLRIRTRKFDPQMTEMAVHQTLRSYGHVVGLISPNDDAIDALFKVDNEIEAERLVNKLDKNLVQEVELLHPTVNSTCKERKLHFEKQLGELREQLQLQLTYLEDLEHLYSAISHIKAQPYLIDFNT